MRGLFCVLCECGVRTYGDRVFCTHSASRGAHTPFSLAIGHRVDLGGVFQPYCAVPRDGPHNCRFQRQISEAIIYQESPHDQWQASVHFETCPDGQESAKLSDGLQIFTHNVLEVTLSFGTHRRFSPSTKMNALLASLRH